VIVLARFDDYHRTVIGYHGTALSTALRIVNRIEGFRWSRRDFDWLGHGIYFWEHAPQQARDWAELRRRQLRKKKNPSADDIRRFDEPIAVVASMIRLGFCFDLLDPDNVEYLLSVFEEYRRSMELSGDPLPENNRKYRRLDCAVFEYAYKFIDAIPGHPAVDTSRSVFVPAGGDRRVWGSSWISRNTHIQLCVRNSASILGTWLHYPTGLEIDDVKEAIGDAQVGIERDHPQGPEESQADVTRAEDRPDGGGKAVDPGAGRTGQEEVG
jgi:hypothetical protein